MSTVFPFYVSEAGFQLGIGFLKVGVFQFQGVEELVEGFALPFRPPKFLVEFLYSQPELLGHDTSFLLVAEVGFEPTVSSL